MSGINKLAVIEAQKAKRKVTEADYEKAAKSTPKKKKS